MPRPKVGDKRTKIMRAAIEKIASEGVSASTAGIAKAAGVAEGSLFRYFADKDTLLNEVYLAIKSEMKVPLTEQFPARGSLKKRAEHLWNGYVSWGAANPVKRQALTQLTVSDRITTESQQAGSEGILVMPTVMEVIAAGRLGTLPPSFAQALFVSIADATMMCMSQDPDRAYEYRAAGFASFWSAATKA